MNASFYSRDALGEVQVKMAISDIFLEVTLVHILRVTFFWENWDLNGIGGAGTEGNRIRNPHFKRAIKWGDMSENMMCKFLRVTSVRVIFPISLFS